MNTNTAAENVAQLLKMGNFHDFESKSFPKDVHITARVLVKLKKWENYSEIRHYTLSKSSLEAMKTKTVAGNFV